MVGRSSSLVFSLAIAMACAAQVEMARADSTAMTARSIRRAKPSEDVLRKELTEIQYEVTQHSGTEPPFHNAYWDNHAPGIYVDVVTGEPLFSSTNKFDSGTGWPSFWQPLDPKLVVEVHDRTHGMDRVEVRSK